MHPAKSLLRLLIPLLGLLAVSACGDDTQAPDRLFLRVTSGPIPGGVRVDALRILLEKGDVRFPELATDAAFNPDLGQLDPATGPVLIGLSYRGDTFGDGTGVSLLVSGRAGEATVASASATIDLGAVLIVDVRLTAIAPSCDADGDGFLDCTIEGCCSDDSPFSDCEPDVAAANPWGAEPACRSCGDTTDYACDGQVPACVDGDEDTVADCDEAECGSADDPNVGPGLQELCDGVDNDCDNETDEGAGALCPSGVCAGGTCADPSCDDDVKNGDETDVDCGGSCGPCLVGRDCTVGGDCTSGVCGVEGTCLAATCDDDVRNGDESDVDCGGACDPCENGLACAESADCQGGLCYNDVCRDAACGDGFVTGAEACDDGAIVDDVASTPVDGDGCSSMCVVEAGWTCTVPVGATASVCATECGDGFWAGAEGCDDENLESGDGCDEDCSVEPGWLCEGEAGGLSVCAFVDDEAPEPPVITAILAGAVDVTDGLTNSATLTAVGTAEAGATLRLLSAGATLGTAAVDGEGAFSVGFGPVADGVYTLTATATDLAQNVSEPSEPVTVTVDTTPPAVTIDAPAITNVTAPTLTGTAEAGATVTVSVGGAVFAVSVTGGTWTLDLGTASPVSGTLSLDLNGENTVSASATDAAGNNATAVPATLTIDTTPPTIAIGALAGDDVLNAVESEAPLTIAGTTAGAAAGRVVTVSLGGVTYEGAVMTGGANGTFAVTVPPSDLLALADGATVDVTADVSDLAGNAATTASRELGIDRTPPNLAIDTLAGNGIINAGKVNNGVSVSGDADGAEDGQLVSVTFGATTRSATVNNGRWSTSFTEAEILAAGQGELEVTADVSDAAGNPAAQATRTVLVDTEGPTLTAIDFGADRLNAEADTRTTTVTFTFDEAPTGFGEADLTVTLTPTTGNASVDGSLLTGLAASPEDPAIWTATLTAPADFEGTLTIAAGTDWEDAAGNGAAAAATSAPLPVDSLRPTVTITFDPTSLNASQTALVTFTFSEAPSSFDAADLDVEGGAIEGLTASSSTVFTATFAPELGIEAGGTGRVTVPVSVTDGAGNGLGAPVSETVALDTLRPTVAIDEISGGFVNLAESAGALLIAGDASGVDGLEVEVSVRDPAGAIVASGTPTVAAGRWSLEVAAGVVGTLIEGSHSVSATTTDAAGNDAVDANLAFVVDLTPPTITIADFAGDNLLNAAEAGVAQVLSGTVTGADEAFVQLRIDGGAVIAVGFEGGAWERTYEASELGALSEGEHVFTADVSDAAGNPAVQAERVVTVDTVGPTLVVSFEDEAGEPKSVILIGDSAVVVYTVSERVTAFGAADVSLSLTPAAVAGGTLTAPAVTANPLRWRSTLIPPTDYEGSGTIAVGLDFTDLAGNAPSSVDDTAEILIDGAAPTAALALTRDQASITALKAGEVATVVITFSEPPSAFELADLDSVGGVVSGLAESLDDAEVFTATFTPTEGFEGAGSVTLGTSWTDTAGNPPVAPSLVVVDIDTALPVLTANPLARTVSWDGATVSLINAADAEGDVTFTGTVTGLEPGQPVELTLDGETYPAVVVGTAWTAVVPQADVAVLSQGLLTATFDATDAAGNAALPVELPVAVLTVPPTVEFGIDSAIINAADVATATLTLSAPPSGFDRLDVVLAFTPEGGGGETVVATAELDFEVVSVDPAVYTVAIRPPADFVGTMVVRVGTDWTDLAGNNPAGAAESDPVPVDTLPPVLTLAADPDALNVAAVSATISVSSSEPMTAPELSDFEVTDAGGVVTGAATLSALAPDPAGVDGQDWTMTLTLATELDGELRVRATPGWTDLAGNAPGAVTPAVIDVDTVEPAVFIDVIGVRDRVGIAGAVSPLVVTFSVEGATGTPEVTLTPAPNTDRSFSYVPVLTSGVDVEPAEWSATIPGADVTALAEGVTYALNVVVVDDAGNRVEAFREFAKDITRPTVAVAWDATSPIAIGTQRGVSFTFSEAPYDFVLADITVLFIEPDNDDDWPGADFLSDLAVDPQDPTRWTATLEVPYDDSSPDADKLELEGDLVVSVGIDWTDRAGNAPDAVSESPTNAVDTLRPTVELAIQPETLTESAPTGDVSISFSEPILGFATGDLLFDTSGLPTTTMELESDPPPVYGFEFTANEAFSGTGTITLRAANTDGSPAWTDAAGNAPAGPVVLSFPVNPPAPTAPTVNNVTYTTQATSQTLSGTLAAADLGDFVVQISRDGFFSARSYTLGEAYTGVTFTVDAGVTPNTWTLVLTGGALLPRSNNDAGPDDYTITATVTNDFDLSAEGTGTVRVTNPSGQRVGTIWDDRPMGSRFQLSRSGVRPVTPAVETVEDNLGRPTDLLPLVDGHRELVSALADGEAAWTDADGDGILAGEELALGLDPGRADSDGDGVGDGDEDTDGDGWSNLDELEAGTDPGDAADAPVEPEVADSGEQGGADAREDADAGCSGGQGHPSVLALALLAVLALRRRRRMA